MASVPRVIPGDPLMIRPPSLGRFIVGGFFGKRGFDRVSLLTGLDGLHDACKQPDAQPSETNGDNEHGSGERRGVHDV